MILLMRGLLLQNPSITEKRPPNQSPPQNPWRPFAHNSTTTEGRRILASSCHREALILPHERNLSIFKQLCMKYRGVVEALSSSNPNFDSIEMQ